MKHLNDTVAFRNNSGHNSEKDAWTHEEIGFLQKKRGREFLLWIILPAFFTISVIASAITGGELLQTAGNFAGSAVASVEDAFFNQADKQSMRQQFPPPISSPASLPTSSPSASFLLADKRGLTHILLAGIPGKGNPAPYLTDTIILASINPDKRAAILVSIPRDLWIKVPHSDFYSKLNGVYQYGRRTSEAYGMELLSEAVAGVTGVAPHYYARIDLAGIQDIVNAIGGITVNVPRSVYDSSYPGPNRSYKLFVLKEGVHRLDGETTLKYIRSRHTARGDFDRIERQQQVMRAIRGKVLSLRPFSDFSELYAFFQSAIKHSATDITLGEGKRIWDIVRGLTDDRIYTTSLTADPKTGLLRYGRIDFGNDSVASVLWPRAGNFNYSQIHSAIADLLANPKEQPL